MCQLSWSPGLILSWLRSILCGSDHVLLPYVRCSSVVSCPPHLNGDDVSRPVCFSVRVILSYEIVVTWVSPTMSPFLLLVQWYCTHILVDLGLLWMVHDGFTYIIFLNCIWHAAGLFCRRVVPFKLVFGCLWFCCVIFSPAICHPSLSMSRPVKGIPTPWGDILRYNVFFFAAFVRLPLRKKKWG